METRLVETSDATVRSTEKERERANQQESHIIVLIGECGHRFFFRTNVRLMFVGDIKLSTIKQTPKIKI